MCFRGNIVLDDEGSWWALVSLCKAQDVIQVESGIFSLSFPSVSVHLFLHSVNLFLLFQYFDVESKFLT